MVAPPFAKGGVQNLSNVYFIYLLRSLKDGGYYIGYSEDVERRFKSHEAGLVESTAHRRPLELIYSEAYISKALAQERERNLKHFGSAYTGLLKRLRLKENNI